MIGPPAEQWSWANMESKIRAANHREWVITLKLDRTPIDPKVCMPFLVVEDRPGSENHERDELQLTYTVTLPPVPIPQPHTVRTTEGEDGEDQKEQSEVFSDEIEGAGGLDSNFEDGESSTAEYSAWSDEETSEVEGETTPEEFAVQYATTNLRKGLKHTFIHSQVIGLAEWNNDFVRVLVGVAHIEFIVPSFLLVNNFEYFRAVFEAGRWSEGSKNTVILEDASPVDFLVLLRFLVHTSVTDFREIDELFYPFSDNSNPMQPHEEHESEYTLLPWVLRLVALAERLCWNGPASRLTEMLDGTLKPSPADRVTLPLMDWLFENSPKGSVLRGWVYNRLLQSLCTGDVDPAEYKEYAEEDPELLHTILQGIVEHPLLALQVSFDEWFMTHFQSLPDGDYTSAQASILGRDFESNWKWMTMLHQSLHNKLPSCTEPSHVWNDDAGWIGCRPGMDCAGCWNNDLGGIREQIARVLVLE